MFGICTAIGIYCFWGVVCYILTMADSASDILFNGYANERWQVCLEPFDWSIPELAKAIGVLLFIPYFVLCFVTVIVGSVIKTVRYAMDTGG